MVLMYLNAKELILRKVASLYPANVIKPEFLLHLKKTSFSGAAEEATTRGVL